MQYGVGRQPCRCAQINSLLEVSHAVSMQSTVSRLLQLRSTEPSTRSRCTCQQYMYRARRDTRFIYEYSTSCNMPIRTSPQGVPVRATVRATYSVAYRYAYRYATKDTSTATADKDPPCIGGLAGGDKSPFDD